jgi:membrane protein YqaA with SNARE-associated domain
MWWQYVLVFVGALLFDIVPFPFFPAFTIMITLQIVFKLNMWAVLVIGVFGSVLGRYILSLYIPHISDRYFKSSKNEDISFLGEKMKSKGWKSQSAIFLYSLLPLPTTPLFVAGGIARLKPVYIIPAFFVGKFISDFVAVTGGKYALENLEQLKAGILSWKSIAGLSAGLLLLAALLFIDWRSLIEHKKFVLNFRIFKSGKEKSDNAHSG